MIYGRALSPDGTADCYFVHPAGGTAPGVLIWPDIFGLRPAFWQMGKRLAESGYSVLVMNPFYRTKKAPTADAGAATPIEQVRPLAQTLNERTHMTDAKAFIAWLDGQSAVAKNRKMGTQGYCMGGPIAFRTAAAVPQYSCFARNGDPWFRGTGRFTFGTARRMSAYRWLDSASGVESRATGQSRLLRNPYNSLLRENQLMGIDKLGRVCVILIATFAINGAIGADSKVKSRTFPITLSRRTNAA